MPFKITTQLVIKIILWILFWGLLASLSAPLMAATDGGGRTSKSISFTKSSDLEREVKDMQLKQVDADIMGALNQEGFRMESTMKSTIAAAHIFDSSYVAHNDVTIYDASTELISDFNGDGFYHRFSVSIDADTVYDTSYIYARLYLSFEGGPWNHYATSDNYHIHGDSELDIFVIETELADGFPVGYYDVRIELYDADIDEWLLSYGPYDDASLSSLPLEDSYYDDQMSVISYPVETQVVVAGHGGSMSWGLILLPAVIRFFRRRDLGDEEYPQLKTANSYYKRNIDG